MKEVGKYFMIRKRQQSSRSHSKEISLRVGNHIWISWWNNDQNNMIIFTILLLLFNYNINN